MSTQTISVTLNPAIDQTVYLAELVIGQVNSAQRSQNDPGGKGINVAACLADWGVRVNALGLLGHDNAEVFSQFFQARQIADHCLRIPGSTRTNIKLVTSAGNTTDINLPGLTIETAHFDAVAAKLATLIQPNHVVVFGGSLPQGLPENAWSQLIAQANQLGARVVLDTSGTALHAALQPTNGAMPFAIKPNRHELEAVLGQHLHGTEAFVQAARTLISRGIRLVVISLGADGALFVDQHNALLARPDHIAKGSSVGAGDAMVAGLVSYLLDQSFDLADCARRATAFAMNRLESGDARRINADRVSHLSKTAVTITPLATN